MRLAEILFRARVAQNEKKVPFKTAAPLKLLDRVSSRHKKVTDRGCLQEITALLTCLEENNFEDKNCIPQIRATGTCYDRYRINMKQSSKQHHEIVPIPNSKNITPQQITYLLRKYPTV